MAENDPANMDWLPRDSAMASIIDRWHYQASGHVVIAPAGVSASGSVGVPAVTLYPDVLLQATVVHLGDRTKEGQLIAGVAIPWFEIIRQLEKDPEFLFKIPWRKLEEIIAGAYERAGWPGLRLGF